jgi:hypothetical protein
MSQQATDSKNLSTNATHVHFFDPKPCPLTFGHRIPNTTATEGIYVQTRLADQELSEPFGGIIKQKTTWQSVACKELISYDWQHLSETRIVS